MGCLALLLLPVLELVVLLKLGARLGAPATIGMLVGSALIGGALARAEGSRVLGQLQAALAAGRAPERALIGGFLVFAGGMLLVFPGVVSDAIGVLLLLPPTRALVVRLLERRWRAGLAAGRIVIGGVGGFPPGRASGRRASGGAGLDDVIDVEAEPIEPTGSESPTPGDDRQRQRLPPTAGDDDDAR